MEISELISNSPVSFSDPDGLYYNPYVGNTHAYQSWRRSQAAKINSQNKARAEASKVGRWRPSPPTYIPNYAQRSGSNYSYAPSYRPSRYQPYRSTGAAYGGSSHADAKQQLVQAATGLAKIVADELGITAGIDCLTTGNIGACGETALNVAMALFLPGGVLAKLAAKYALRWGKLASLVARVEKLGGEIVSSIRTLMGKDPGGCNSFVPGTRVRMADGTSTPIQKVKTGDKVLATDPETGGQAAKTVLATIIGSGAKRLVEITVDTSTEKHPGEDGRGEGAPGPSAVGEAIVATDEHPFWVPELREWVDAGDLRSGTWLQTAAGTWAQVTATKAWTQTATVHNLTIQDIHTYNVLIGNASVLVRNSNGTGCTPGGVSNLRDGAHMTTNDALDTAVNFVGVDYRDMGGGRFLSQDGLRQVRMTDADLAHRRQNPHINFETYSQSIGPGVRAGKPASNIHIYLPEEPGWHQTP